jgi:MFS superfamily sulfate permease-like transporter
VVRGLQLALGLKLLSGGISMIAGTGQWFAWDGIGVGLLCAVLVLVLYFSTRVPGALVVFLIGLVVLFVSTPSLISQTVFGFDWRLPDLTDPADWESGFLRGAIPQIPLTTLNSIIAVCALSVDLFPASPAAPRRVAVSVALMNLICCPFGGMPMCHGAGGLAGQYRFGARTGGSVVLLGIAKIVLALLFGTSLLMWLQAYPQSVLGVLLIFSGMELALVCRDQTTRQDYFVVLLTAGTCMALNTAAGFLVGWIVATLLHWKVFRIEPRQ